MVAQTDKLYVDMQALSPEEIVLNRFTADGWSMETVVDLDLREKLQDLETENMLERKENPPVPVVVDPNNPEAKPGEVPAKPPAKPPAKEDPNA